MKRVSPTPKALQPLGARRMTATITLDYLADGTVSNIVIDATENEQFVIDARGIGRTAHNTLFNRLRTAVINEFQSTNKR